MSQPSPPLDARYAISADELEHCIDAAQGVVIVDFDETLLLRNSTELFLDGIRPQLLGVLMLQLLELIKPWRLTGGERSRDLWRVRLALVLFPWVMSRWRRRVTEHARQWTNPSLHRALSRRADRPIIASIGFTPIIAPLLAAMGYADAPLIACRVWSSDRMRGKLALVAAQLPAATIAGALFVTDSRDDLDLLQASGRGCLLKWADARYIPALSRRYLPFRYLAMVKRPGEKYLRRGILQEDFAFWVLASITLSPAPWLHVPGLALLLLSFWAIYERGYVDNDHCAHRYEQKPKLTPQYFEQPVETPAIEPWIWAVLAGAAGVLLLRGTDAGVWPLLQWLAVLISVELLFRLYNRSDKSTRTWMFAGLQWLRTVSFAAVVAVTPAGVAALCAHTIARWVPYYAYRHTGGDWPEGSMFLSRLMFFVILLSGLAIVEGWRWLGPLSVGLLMLWNLFRARKELMRVLNAAHRIDRKA